MNKEDDKIKKEYLKKVKLFKKHNELYYSKDSPIMVTSTIIPGSVSIRLIVLSGKFVPGIGVPCGQNSGFPRNSANLCTTSGVIACSKRCAC